MHSYGSHLALIGLIAWLALASARADTGKTETQVSSSKASLFGLPDRPWVGIEVSGGVTGLARQEANTGALPMNFEKLPIRAQIDVQPFHSFGVLSVGPTGEYWFTGVMPEFRRPGVEATLNNALSLGGQARYQALFARTQVIVPTVAYSLESFSYKITNGPSGRFNAQGPTFGLWVNLGAIDRASARTIHSDLGVSRAYLTLERRTLEGGDGLIDITGSSYQAGLRIEL